MNRGLNWTALISGVIDCLVMSLFVAMSAGVTWLIWH